MNGVFLAILAIIIVAVLSFLMPWVSKKIEEPFTASSCADPSVTTPVAISPRPNTWADHVELGKQKYNFLGLLQSEPTRRAFDAPSAMGSIDDTPRDDGPSMLKKLNKNLQNAFETVFLDPQTKDATGAVTPNISLGPSSTPVLNNAPTYFADAMKPERAERRGRVGYVEERLPPRDQGLEDAKTCEVNNLFYERKSGDTVSERVTPISRGAMCKMLDTSETNPINNAFPTDPNKICGVCIKGAKPISSPTDYNPGNKAYNGIGGMFISKGDKNRDIAAAGGDETKAMYKPSYGTCEEGYFFVPGQQDKCMKAAKRLNCEEIQSTGGFDGGAALDRTVVSSSDCRACIDSSKVNYVYYDEINPGPKGVRLRIVVPTGTGRTFIKITHTQTGAGGSIAYGPFTFTSTKTIPATITEIKTGEALHNVGYFTINAAKPGDSIRIQALQEFPHRPRGEKEVFFVGFAGKFADAQKLADSLDCDLATADQLMEAQRNGMQVCEAGWASNGIYTVRTNAITNNNFSDDSDDSECKLYTNNGNVQRVVNLSPSSSTQDASGAWLYGIKPSAEFIKSQSVDDMNIDPKISNFYTYYKLTDNSGISPAQKNSKYFNKSATVPLPNYRGICVQMEQNTTTTPQNFTPINVGIENYITSIGTDTITGDLVNRLSKYSRNGRFNDSERIARPKPPQTGTNAFSTINQNQYWLWAPYSTTEQSPAFDATFVVPGFFELPTYTEDVAKCRGVLYDRKSHLDMAMPTACDNGLTKPCIESLFQKAGGDLTKGTLSPINTTSGETNLKIIKYKDYDAANPTKVLQSERNVDEVKLFLENIKARMKGTDPALKNMTDAERIAAMNMASQQLIGRNAVGPCERVSDTDTDTGIKIIAQSKPFDEKCLDFLYRNTTGDNNNALPDLKTGTYGALGNFFSGLKWPDEYSMASANDLNAFPYRACQPTGSWAPIQNGVANTKAVSEINAAISLIDGLPDIKKAIQVFKELHDKANSNSVTAADQELAIERCYGIKKKTFVTNCNGIVGKLLKIMDFSGVAVSGTVLNVKLNSESAALPDTFNFAEKAVEKITVSRVVPGAATSYIVLLKDANGVVAQKVLRDISSSPVTLEFLQEDVRPYISYNDILNITGTTTLRFESAFGRQYFLRSDGTISNEGADNNTKFDLVAPQQTLLGATNVYSLKSLTSTTDTKYITKGTDSIALSPTTAKSSIQSSSTRTSNADWAIERAVNGAYAFVSIALANTPGYYLVAERQPNNTLVAKAKVINKTNDFDAFSACWRLYPAGS